MLNVPSALKTLNPSCPSDMDLYSGVSQTSGCCPCVIHFGLQALMSLVWGIVNQSPKCSQANCPFSTFRAFIYEMEDESERLDSSGMFHWCRATPLNKMILVGDLAPNLRWNGAPLRVDDALLLVTAPALSLCKLCTLKEKYNLTSHLNVCRVTDGAFDNNLVGNMPGFKTL